MHMRVRGLSRRRPAEVGRRERIPNCPYYHRGVRDRPRFPEKFLKRDIISSVPRAYIYDTPRRGCYIYPLGRRGFDATFRDFTK